MLDLDNFDLELDEDIPSGPLNKSDLFESFSESFPWSQNKCKGNGNSNSSQQSNFIQQLFKVSESTQLTQNISGSCKRHKENPDEADKNDTQNVFNISDLLNKSYNSKALWGSEENENNDPKGSSSTKRISTQRKFPGPAGLLPDKPLSDMNIIVHELFDKIPVESKKESVILCSQSSSVFGEPSFQKLLSDFDMNSDDSPFKKYTIDWIKKGALKKTLFGKKIPFLALILSHIDHSTPDPVLTLRDSTGEIYGTLHREVWAELGSKLQPGAALALRQVGVFVTGIARRQIYLNITINNIVNIYCCLDDEVETNKVNEVNIKDVMKSTIEWQCTTSNVEPNGVPQLFSTIGGRKSNSPINMTPNNKPSSKYSTKTFPTLISKSAHSKQKCTASGALNSNNNPQIFTNLMTAMEDDMSDFLASLDDESFGENSSSVGSSGQNQLKEKEMNDNVKKRKIVGKDACSPIKKSQCIFQEQEPNQSSHSSNAIAKAGNEGKHFLACQPLSQAESQLLEEVLDGVDFDDF